MLAQSRAEGSSLKKWSFNPAEYQGLKTLSLKDRAEALNRNLDSYVNHVLEDNVVSIPYYYRLGSQNEILVYPNNTPVYLDERERGGAYKKGLTEALKYATDNPGNLTLLYSPPGKTSFDDDPNNPYTQVGSYNEGQLYMMYSDGFKVNNVAVSVSKSGEGWVKDIFEDIYEQAESMNLEEERISHLITHPLKTGIDIETFLSIWNHDLDRVIYKNNKKHEYTLRDTLGLIRQSFAGKLAVSMRSRFKVDDLTDDKLTEGFMIAAYKDWILAYMVANNLESIKLGGSCGDGEVSKESLLSIVNGNFGQFINNISSLDRLLKQKGPKELTEDESKKDRFYECKSCHGSIPYEKNVKDRAGWLTNCPHCGANLKGICV